MNEWIVWIKCDNVDEWVKVSEYTKVRNRTNCIERTNVEKWVTRYELPNTYCVSELEKTDCDMNKDRNNEDEMPICMDWVNHYIRLFQQTRVSHYNGLFHSTGASQYIRLNIFWERTTKVEIYHLYWVNHNPLKISLPKSEPPHKRVPCPLSEPRA